MNGYVYYKFPSNLRNCCRNCGDADQLKRKFCFSAKWCAPNQGPFSYKPLLEKNYRKVLWDDLKNECNEKLTVLGEILTKQCNFIASHRARRMSQIWNLYATLYSRKSLGHIVSQFARNLKTQKQSFTFLLGVALFSWEKEKITDEEIINFAKLDEYLFDDLRYVRTCESICNSELNGFQNQLTQSNPRNSLVKGLISDGWEAIIQKESVQVWRKPFPNSYLYEYKILGTFYDVPARTFFNVQTDTEYRKKWDKLVIKLDVIDKEEADDGCEVMHWVMHYPYPMYSREYVYVRRAVVNPETNTMVLVNRSIEHPSCPMNKKYVRVTNYTSRMVIRPHRTYDDNGFDYVLTYFDDPQAAFPAPAYNWMASSGVPDFVEKLHNAARELHYQQKKSKSSLAISNSQNTPCSGDIEYAYM